MICAYAATYVPGDSTNPLRLVSIGMARPDGATLYAVSSEARVPSIQSAGIGSTLLPHLPTTGPTKGVRGGTGLRLDLEDPAVRRPGQIVRLIRGFLADSGTTPQLWALGAAHAHVLLEQLWNEYGGEGGALPELTWEVRQEVERSGVTRLPGRASAPGHALHDALYALECVRALGFTPPP